MGSDTPSPRGAHSHDRSTNKLISVDEDEEYADYITEIQKLQPLEDPKNTK